jgi:hypothetical protein
MTFMKKQKSHGKAKGLSKEGEFYLGQRNLPQSCHKLLARKRLSH